MAPRFKAEDFNGGISQGVEAILAQLAGGDVPLPEAAEASPRRESFFQGPELPIVERLLFGAFIFGIIGLFTVIGVMTPGAGWFLYFFLIPFWAMFPIVVVGTNGALTLLVTYLLPSRWPRSGCPAAHGTTGPVRNCSPRGGPPSEALP
jgi:uncharacterized protein